MRRAGTLLATAVLLVALWSGIAIAAKRYPTTATAPHYANTIFTGKVTAGGGCQANRNVNINFTSLTGQNDTSGSGKTNSKGHYRVDSPENAQSGTYVARVSKRIFKVHGVKHVCLAATSPPLVIP
jgi:hypothetical protein